MKTRTALAALAALGHLALSAPVEPVAIGECQYGAPWTPEARIAMVEWGARHGWTMHIYSPKLDPFHRTLWRVPYPPDRLTELRDLARACRDSGVDLCFGVLPGMDITYSDARDRAALLSKILCLQSEGVRHFFLALDDIDVSHMAAADRERYASVTEAQMDLANWLADAICDRVPDAWLLYSPSQYVGIDPSHHWDVLRETLDPRWHVAWCGQDIVSPTVTRDDVERITALIGRPPFFWDNYPVNDFALQALFLGPYVNRDPEMVPLIDGYATTPMIQPFASQFAMATIPEFLADPQGYDPEASWQRAIDEIGGAAAADLRAVVELFRENPLKDNDTGPVVEAVDAFLADGDPESVQTLRSAIANVRAAAVRLPGEISPELAAEFAPFLAGLDSRLAAMELAASFAEGTLSPESTPAALSVIARDRASGWNAARVPAERLYAYAIGRQSTPEAEPASHRIDAVDPPPSTDPPGGRGENQLILYTPAYGQPYTGTNQWGQEARVVGGAVERMIYYDAAIPPDGYVVSGHGEACIWVREHLRPGVRLERDGDTLRVVPDNSPQAQRDRRRAEVLSALAEAVQAGDLGASVACRAELRTLTAEDLAATP